MSTATSSKTIKSKTGNWLLRIWPLDRISFPILAPNWEAKLIHDAPPNRASIYWILLPNRIKNHPIIVPIASVVDNKTKNCKRKIKENGINVMNHLLVEKSIFFAFAMPYTYNVCNDFFSSYITCSAFASAIMLNIRKNSNGMIKSKLIERFHKRN